MAKGQKRSNREAKKPKQPKNEKSAGANPALVTERAPVASARIGAKIGRR